MSKILYAAGTAEHIRNFHLPYIKALRAEGHEVAVMAGGAGADIDIPFVKKMLSPKNLFLSFKVGGIIRRQGFDAVILNTTLASFVVRFSVRRKKRPRVINLVHGYMFGLEAKGIRDKIFLLAERLLRKKTDSIMVMNSEDYRIAKRYRLCIGEVRMTRGMGAEVRGAPSKQREYLRRYYGFERKYILCFVGELCAVKNQSMLICALPEIKRHIPNAVLWLVGSGLLKDELILLAKKLGVSDSVCFMGRRDNPCDYIRACDIYVSASKKEGLPFNIVEALGCGAAVIASDVKGQRDVIEDGISGLLYPTDDIMKFVRLVCAVHDGEIRIDENEALARYKTYSLDAVFLKTYGIMKELVEK